MSTEKPADPLKALLRERDEQSLRKKLEREWASEAIIRLRTLERVVEDYGHRWALVEKRVARLSKMVKE